MLLRSCSFLLAWSLRQGTSCRCLARFACSSVSKNFGCSCRCCLACYFCGITHNIKILEITRNRYEVFVNFKSFITLVAATAKRYDVPFAVGTIGFLHMCPNKIAPMMAVSSTTSISLVTCVIIPIVQPRRITFGSGVTPRTVYVFYVHYIITTLLCGLLLLYQKRYWK